MPKEETKVKMEADEKYGKQFCVMMNTDVELTDFINTKLKKSMDKYAMAAIKLYPTRDTEAMDKVLYSTRGEIMSLIAWIYGKARVKEEEMKN